MTQILQCPHCEHDHIHQVETQLYCRDDSEDAVLVLVNMYDGMISQAKAPPGSNPSTRRHGMRLIFSCEGCDEYPQLVMHQHKGDTVLEWEAV